MRWVLVRAGWGEMTRKLGRLRIEVLSRTYILFNRLEYYLQLHISGPNLKAEGEPSLAWSRIVCFVSLND